MDLSFHLRFPAALADAVETALPGEEAARLAAPPSAGPLRGRVPLAPADGAFNGAMAARLIGWRQG